MVAIVDHRGLHDWITQRVTALVIAAYGLFILGFMLLNSPLNFGLWQHLFQHVSMRVFTFLTALAVAWHAWIGLWTVFTDYVKNQSTRLWLQVALIVLLVIYLSWCFDILWA